MGLNSQKERFLGTDHHIFLCGNRVLGTDHRSFLLTNAFSLMKMARKPRYWTGSGLYRIWMKGNPQNVLFRDREDFSAYLTALSYAKRRNQLKLYHYSLLRNEVFLIMEVPTAQALSSILQSTHIAFHWYNRRKYRKPGSLWYDRFRHKAVSTQELLKVGQEVEYTSVRAGLANHPADYPYSSYAYYALGFPNPYLDPNPQYLALAQDAFHRQQEYARLSRDC